MHSLDIRGTLTMPTSPADPTPVKKVFQKTAPGKGNLRNTGRFDRQLRAYVIPYDPQTPAQIARRDLFRAAVARWRTPTAQDLAQWKLIAHNRNIPLFNASLRDTLKNYRLVDGELVRI